MSKWNIVGCVLSSVLIGSSAIGSSVAWPDKYAYFYRENFSSTAANPHSAARHLLAVLCLLPLLPAPRNGLRNGYGPTRRELDA